MTIQKNDYLFSEKKNYPLSSSRIKRLVLRTIENSETFLKKNHGGSDKKKDKNVISIRFTGNDESKKLNYTYRKKNYPTNVLTFSYELFPRIIADILICIPVAEKERILKRINIDQHVAHLIVHGVLHAAGFDHRTNTEAEIMEKIETTILKKFRIPNPYLKK